MAVRFGITKHGGALVEAVDVERKIEVGVLKNSRGVDAHVHPYNRTKSFSLKTRGEDSELDVGAGDPEITGISGGVIMIESVKNGEVNTDFPTEEASGNHFPNATLVAEDEGED